MNPSRTRTPFSVVSAGSLLISLFILGAFSGCGKEEAQYIEVEAVDEKPLAVVEDHTGHNHGTNMGEPQAPFEYTLPEGWKIVPTRSMQLMTIEAGQEGTHPANVSVSAFPGEVGGKAANINRWRGQIGLGPVSAEVAEEFITPATVAGLEGWQVDFTGAAPAMDAHGAARLVVTAVFHNGQTWFFKLVGADSSVQPELERYNQFVSSVSF